MTDKVKQKPIPMKCPCGYEWEYGGKRTVYATCPNCFKPVKIEEWRQDKK